ncbi:hypothetical protein T484DRAFT_1780205 [Baffinella frigidus]|nr:hypothetical protein T484DRAFT_1780205 [Cryptophyta sp. CCMP2293]
MSDVAGPPPKALVSSERIGPPPELPPEVMDPPEEVPEDTAPPGEPEKLPSERRSAPISASVLPWGRHG